MSDVHAQGGSPLSCHRHDRVHLLVLLVGLAGHSKGHSIDARVQNTHDHQCGPEVADLKADVESGVFEVLHVTLTRPHCALANVVPAKDGGEKEEDGYDPGG